MKKRRFLVNSLNFEFEILKLCLVAFRLNFVIFEIIFAACIDWKMICLIAFKKMSLFDLVLFFLEFKARRFLIDLQMFIFNRVLAQATSFLFFL